jgi:hypothetical protein
MSEEFYDGLKGNIALIELKSLKHTQIHILIQNVRICPCYKSRYIGSSYDIWIRKCPKYVLVQTTTIRDSSLQYCDCYKSSQDKFIYLEG